MIIKLETAILAKKKGFDVPTFFFYFQNYNAGLDYILVDYIGEGQFDTIDKEVDHNDGKFLLNRYSAPTQSELQTWLREKHNIIVSVIPRFYGVNVEKMDVKYYYTISVHKDNRQFDKWEDCLEVGLQEALNEIKL